MDSPGTGLSSPPIPPLSPQSTQSQRQLSWPNYLASYMPDLEHGRSIKESLDDFEKTKLSDDTAVHVLAADRSGTISENGVFNYTRLCSHIKTTKERPPSFCVISINRYLKVRGQEPPADTSKFQISKDAFRNLISNMEVSPTFIAAVANRYIPLGPGSRQNLHFHDPDVFEFWYNLPVRIQLRCTDTTQEHTSSTTGQFQMNPAFYLHLLERKVDIRGSQIAVYFQHNRRTHSTNVIVFNLLDGRWPRIVQEPMDRIRESLQVSENLRPMDDPFFVHIVYLTSVLYWWLNVLSSFKDQLIAHDSKVQEFDTHSENDPTFNHRINKTLHCMVAHLHRYGSELDMLGDAVDCISQNHDEFFKEYPPQPPGTYHPADRVERCLLQVRSQLRSAVILRKELELKVSNILALLFNNIQVANDRLQVRNGDIMAAIMKATQSEATQTKRMALQSQKLAEEMKEDSIAMKTIAILTLIFLPGTFFSAILAMPFFDDDPWMKQASKFWVWILLTVPCTGAAFLFYMFWRKRERERKKKRRDETTIELQQMTTP